MSNSGPAQSSEQAATSDPTPSDPVGTGVRNASSIVDLFIKVIDKGAGAWQQGSSDCKKRTKAEGVLKDLKDGLGEWEDEAKDEKGRWRQPFLGKDAYEKHLVKNDGRLRPSGKSTALFGWAQLLFALNIRPKSEIVSWKPLHSGIRPEKTGTLSLLVDGAILCHIINLYQLYKSGSRNSNIHRFLFGELTVENDAKHVFAFNGRSDADLSSDKLPFQFSMQDQDGLREGNVHFDAGFLDIQYQFAINIGISEPKAELVKSKPGGEAKALQERADSLVNAMRLIHNLDWNKPSLISPEWAEDASRIKRRMTSGKEEFLLGHIVDCLSKKADVVMKLQSCLARPDLWEDEVKSSIRAMSNNPTFDLILKGQMPWVLRDLGAWSTSSSEEVSPDTLLKVLEMPHEIINLPVMVLPGVPKDWDFVAEISC